MSNIDEDVRAWAAALPEKPPLSKLEPYAGAIRELRRKRYTYDEIAKLLNERFGVAVHSTSILRFLQRERKKAKAVGSREGKVMSAEQQEGDLRTRSSGEETFSYHPGQALEREEK